MYTRVAKERCIACGLCQIKAPHLFDYTTDGIAYGRRDDNTGTEIISDEFLPEFKIAYTRCPTKAIERSNTPFE